MNIIIGEIKRSGAERLVFKVLEYNDRLRADIRSSVLGKDGEWYATKKGIAVDVDYWPVFMELVNQIDAEMQKLGVRDT